MFVRLHCVWLEKFEENTESVSPTRCLNIDNPSFFLSRNDLANVARRRKEIMSPNSTNIFAPLTANVLNILRGTEFNPGFANLPQHFRAFPQSCISFRGRLLDAFCILITTTSQRALCNRRTPARPRPRCSHRRGPL